MRTMNLVGLVGGCGLAALLLFILHWFPWATFLGHSLGKLPSYIVGVASLFAGFLLWAGLSGNWQAAMALALVVVSGGGAVLAAYGIDWLALRVSKARKAERTNGGQ